MDNNDVVTERWAEIDPDAVALCSQCLAPADPFVHYCRHCGADTGDVTRFVPYVNIRFWANFYGSMWRTFWYDPTARLATRTLCALLITLFAPVMLVAVPFVLWTKFRRQGGSSDDTRLD
jgi:hypothetical protein